ncbi:MAG: glycosidase [Chloroflexi bacterium]|nr:glycosidase [Chloroflexota bacterium]
MDLNAKGTTVAGNDEFEVLFHRYERNPILTREMWPYPCNSVLNPGAIRLADGTTLLLCRVEDFRGHSHLTVARSADGRGGWEIDREPSFAPDLEQFPEELWGVEDPRISYIPELEKYSVVYVAYSRGGPAVSLALTEDFRHYERLGLVLPPENKDAALLPRRFDGLWMLIHRPVMPGLGQHIWISSSKDLIHWGHHHLILEARYGGWWDADKIGLSPPMIETPEGWIMIYHGVRVTASGRIYRLGLALFDLEDPTKALLRGDSWVFGPSATYEREGDVPNVVFPCGYTIDDDGDTLNIYYGVADTAIAMAHASITDILHWLKRHGRPVEHTPVSGWETRPLT